MKQEGRKRRNYIVFDLEWNQCADGKAGEIPGLPFEVIEIGAVKLNENFELLGEFSRFVRPEVYKKLHFKVLEIVHVGMEELRRRGEPFSEAIRDFFSWCEEDVAGKSAQTIFCTWGSMDLTELQRNLAYHGVKNPFPYPLLYYDVQKLYSRLYQDNCKDKLTLERALGELGLGASHPFHMAIEDARYTGEILKKIDFCAVEAYLSLDYYRIPERPEDEIYLVFPEYAKYVSRGFQSREELIQNKTVTDLLCCRCNRMLKKKIRWFSVNQRNYLCLGSCPEHGAVRGKIRIRRAEDGRYYCVKTMRAAGEEEAVELAEKQAERTGKRREKMQLKRRRKRLRRSEKSGASPAG